MAQITPIRTPPKRGVVDGAYRPETDKLRVVVALKTAGGGRYKLLRLHESGHWLVAKTFRLDDSEGAAAISFDVDVLDTGELYHVQLDDGAADVEVWMRSPTRPGAGTVPLGGPLVLDGASDADVLNVRQRATVQRLLRCGRLWVGRGALGAGTSGGSGGPGQAYAVIDADGAAFPTALVLASPSGALFQVKVGDGGALETSPWSGPVPNLRA